MKRVVHQLALPTLSSHPYKFSFSKRKNCWIIYWKLLNYIYPKIFARCLSFTVFNFGLNSYQVCHNISCYTILSSLFRATYLAFSLKKKKTQVCHNISFYTILSSLFGATYLAFSLEEKKKNLFCFVLFFYF